MAKIHVLLKKEELERERLPGKTVVVLDVLFATTSIVTVLAHGAAEVLPLLDGPAALEAARGRAAGSYVLSGELNAETLQGFCHPTPLSLLREGVAGRSMLYCTTNGTVALAKAREADRVYAAALLNGAAVVRALERLPADDTVLLVCAGSADRFNLEDFYGAGYLVSLLTARGGGHELSDSAVAARFLYDRCDAEECLRASRVGRMMLERGLAEEVAFAARKSRFDVVPELDGARLRSARPAAAARP
jgi:2-phosphosulfolactate phosphatase